jgi:hypothetical protein
MSPRDRARHTRAARVRRYREASRLLRVCPFGARLAGPFHAADPASIACTSLLSKTTFFAARLFGAGVMKAEKLNGPEIGRIPTRPVSGTILSGPRQLGASRAPPGVCTTCTAGLRVGRVRLARELRRRARGWTSLARGGRQGLHDLTWCAADPGTVLWTARGASPATGASRVTALTISVFVWCVRPPSRGSNHGRGRASRAYAQPVEQDPMQRRPHPGRLPVAEPSPAGHAGIVAHLLGQPRPRDAAWSTKAMPSSPCDRRAAGGRPSGAAVVRGARAPPVPRARRRPDVRNPPRLATPHRSREVSLRALNTSRVSVHPPSILSRHRQEPRRGSLRGPLRHDSHNRAFPRCGGLQLTFCADSANRDPGQESHVTSLAAPAATGGKRAAKRVGSLRRSGSRT